VEELTPVWFSHTVGVFARDIDFEFQINGEPFTELYWLADGIYPETARFATALDEPSVPLLTDYKTWQESSRKLIERAFGVLQTKFQCLVRPVLMHNRDDISNMVVSCIMMHNMMVEHRRSLNEVENTNFYDIVRDLPDDTEDEDETTTLGDTESETTTLAGEEPILNAADRLAAYQEARAETGVLEDRHAVVNERWSGLYDVEKYQRLVVALANEVSGKMN
jgi:hypothetical protein